MRLSSRLLLAASILCLAVVGWFVVRDFELSASACNHDVQAWMRHEFALDDAAMARIASLHVAGHYDEAEDLKVDTHGAPVKDDVWDLLAHAYRAHGVRPTLLERDFNFPPLAALLDEVQRIRDMQADVA